MQRSRADLAGYVVRPPVAFDSVELGRMHCTAWQQTYADVMCPQAYVALSPERFAQTWSRTISAPTGTNFLAEHATDGIVGFITVGPPRNAQPPAPRQLWALNIATEHHGTGLAKHLMAEVLGDGPHTCGWLAAMIGRSPSTNGTDSPPTAPKSSPRTESPRRMVRHG